MMEIRTLEQLQASQAATTKKDASSLGQDDFMTLMLQQLKNQDPFKPTDNTEFISQMAQLTQVSSISEMNENLAGLTGSMYSSQLLDASSLIGKDVLINSSTAYYNGSNDVSGQVELPVSTQALNIEILSPSGEVVAKLPMGPQTAGASSFSWDGTGLDGEVLPPGNYVIQASYLNGNTYQALETQVRSPVKSISVSTAGGSPMVQLEGLGSVSITDLAEIS
ncbi:flagellar hook assembly protein FlgD [Spongiibacter sp. KMU-158]|uniref:Basal-body rod modification protein FlgD n=1 Tax=Spongiibacter pelagi TaxID=2760804 RepID=A0A927C1F1_9GAMM|nr:flagellar hook assembly protein FlgD [Spongiibacter pelagi]MBD2858413.1 flagellar hook assembly protein FlgD [Spongiibacter pelagi]